MAKQKWSKHLLLLIRLIISIIAILVIAFCVGLILYGSTSTTNDIAIGILAGITALFALGQWFFPFSSGKTVSDVETHSLTQEGHGEDNFISDPKSKTALITGYIPHKNHFFIGREEELKVLRDTLLQEKIAVITGMPGIGKTQIAAEYVYQHQHQYQYIIWGNASLYETLVISYSEFAKRVKLAQTDKQDELIREVKYWLQQNDSWLLILDNVENAQVAKNDFMPAGGRGHVILTTQLTDVGNISSKLIEVKPVKEDLGALFLLRRAGKLPFNEDMEQSSVKDRKAALEISRQVEGYLLLLDIAGAYIRQSKCSVSNYLEQFMYQPIAYLNLPGDDYPYSVIKVFSITFNKIEVLSPVAGRVLNFCAFLYHDVIPEKLIKIALKKQKLVPKDFNLNDVIAVLNTFSIVERIPQTNTIYLHTLIQQVRRYTMKKGKLHYWERQSIQAMGKAFPNVEPKIWDYCQLCMPHAQACIALLEQEDILSQYISKKDSLLSTLVLFFKLNFIFKNKTFINDISRLLYQVAHYLQERGFYSKAEPLVQQSLDLRKKIFGLKHILTAKAMQRLASIYVGQGNLPAAKELYQQVVLIFEKLNNRGLLAETLNSLAGVYRNEGKYKQAEPLYVRALQFSQAEYGLQTNQAARIMNSLAELYRNQGDYNQALPLARGALEISKQNGYLSRNTAQMIKSLSELYRSMGRYKEAEDLCKESLKIYKKIVGFEHLEVANCLNRLARYYLQRNQFKVAECLCQRSLKIEESILGKEHHTIIYSLNTLARIYRKNKITSSQTESLLKRALQIAEKTFGDHPQTAECLINLAAFYSERRDDQEAENLYLQAVKMDEQQVGSNHIKTAFAYDSIARHYRNRKEYLKAEPFFQQALEIHKLILGENSLHTAHCYFNLALNYDFQKHPEQAQSYYEHALDTYLQVLGPVHSATLNIINQLRKNYIIQSKYHKADFLDQRIISFLEQISEQKAELLDTRVADIYFRQAKSCSISEQYDVAESFFKRALMIYLQVFGSKHSYTTEAFRRLDVLDGTGISGQKTLEEYLEELGSKYIQITEVLFHIATNYSYKHQYKMAIWYYFRVAIIIDYKTAFEKRTQKQNKMLNDTYSSLGYNYLKIGNQAESKYFFEKANSVIEN